MPPWCRLPVLGLSCGAFFAGPAFFHDLSGAADGQRVFGDVCGDARCCTDVCAFAYAHGRDQSAVAADEDSVVDHGCVLVDAVVVAGDGSGADVDARADFGVAEIGQVVGLRSLAQLDLLGLDEIADVRAFADFAAGAQMRIRAEDCAGADAGFFEMQPGRMGTPSPISESRITE